MWESTIPESRIPESAVSIARSIRRDNKPTDNNLQQLRARADAELDARLDIAKVVGTSCLTIIAYPNAPTLTAG